MKTELHSADSIHYRYGVIATVVVMGRQQLSAIMQLLAFTLYLLR